MRMLGIQVLFKSTGLKFLSHKNAFYDSVLRFMEIKIITSIQQFSHLNKGKDCDVFDV